MSIDLMKMPKLGFGLMRLPQKDGAIDNEEVCRMVDAYMDSGMNYFDTAYIYHGGKSECAAKTALVERYPRESFLLATKLPVWEVKCFEDRDRIFQEQLERAGVDYFDFYLLHSVEDGNIKAYEEFDCFDWGISKRADGRIRHFGFSFHGSPELLEKVLDEHPEIEFVQIQLNYLDWENPVVCSGKLYEILHRRNIPMIVMEPVKGGILANLVPELEVHYKALRPDASAASWALRFVGSLPQVMTILSGMTNEDQMKDNIDTFRSFEPLSEAESALVEKVRKTLMDVPQIGCTGCQYCIDGCPVNIAIPDVFRAVNTVKLYGEEFRPKAFYNGLVDAGLTARASECLACGQCESVCPQHLPIIKLIADAGKAFDA